MTTTTHGANADCPKVRSGEWTHCHGHTKPSQYEQRIQRIITEVGNELGLATQESLDAVERAVRRVFRKVDV